MCQQGTGAGWRLRRAAQGCMGDPSPTAPHANLRHWWEHAGTTAGCFIAGAPIAHVSLRRHQQCPWRAHLGCWCQGDVHVCAPAGDSKRILAGASSPAAIAACGQVTRAHGRQLGAERGPSHLSLPEAGARDSNGAFRLVRASYCR